MRIIHSFVLIAIALSAIALTACNVISSSAPTATPTVAIVQPPIGVATSQPSSIPGSTAAPTPGADAGTTPTKVAFAVATETPARAAAPTSTATTSAPRPAAPTGKIAYSISTTPDDDPQFRSIWVANADGTNARTLITYAWSPVFSPDGKQIAYYGKPRSAPEGMYVANADGGNPVLALNDATACCFNWSRDGAWIVYTDSTVKTRPGGPIKLLKMDGLYKTITDLKVTGSNPVFSPDGKLIAYSGGEPNTTTLGIMVAPTDGSGAARVLTRDNGGNPHWSPDGRHIVYQAPSDDQHRQVFVVNADGSGRRRLTNGRGNDIQPIYSRDGNLIFYRSDQNGTSWAIFVMNADGSNPRRLIANTPPHDKYWGWESLSVAP
jgi:Tol biopolymer transport system component